jgi:hypothetical protein
VCPASTILFPSVLCFCRAKCLIHIVLIWGCIPFLLHQIFLWGAEIADAPPKKVVIAKVWLQLCSFFLYQNWIAHLFLFAGLFGCVDIVSSKIIVDQNVILVYQRTHISISKNSVHYLLGLHNMALKFCQMVKDLVLFYLMI